MKNALLLFSLIIGFASASAQISTADKLLDKLSCKDTTCFFNFFNTMGYQPIVQPQTIGKNFKLYPLQSNAADCQWLLDSIGRESVELIAVDNTIVKIELTTCYERYKVLLSDLIKKGFVKIDEDTKFVTLHSKYYPNWEVAILNEYTMHHSGLYSIRLDKINNVIKN